jgi:hypothetical protein
MSAWRLVANIILFQVGWFSCLLLDTPWLYLVVILLLVVHIFGVVPHSSRLTELCLLAKVVLVGALLEVVYFQTHVLERTDGGTLPPEWLLLIWLLFATTFLHSLAWLRERLYLAAAFAAIAAPLSYYAGANVNAAVSLNESVVFSLLSIAVSWSLVFPLLLLWVVPKKTRVMT